MLQLLRRMLIVFAVSIGAMVIVVPAASAMETGWTWFPPGAYAKFDANETSSIVQVGVVGAASYVSSQMPTPILKATAAILGTSLWLTAREALNSADRKCLVVVASVWEQSAYPAAC